MARRVKFEKFESDCAEALRCSLTGENVNDLNGFILTNLDVQGVCMAAQTSIALSIRCKDSQVWMRLYDARWKTRVGIPKGLRPSRRHYIQRALVLRTSTSSHRLPSETYSFTLQVSDLKTDTTIFEGTTTVSLQDTTQKRPSIKIENSVQPLTGGGASEESVRATLIVSRHSDQAMANVWDIYQRAWGGGKPDINKYTLADQQVENGLKIRPKAEVLTAMPHATLEPAVDLVRSLLLPGRINLDQKQLAEYSTTGAVAAVELDPQIWSSAPDCVPYNQVLETCHDFLSALSLSAFKWHTC